MKSIIACATFVCFASSASADQILLQDANSSATFDTAAGQINWIVDGTANLFDQSFYFRRATDTRELQVNDSNLGLQGFFSSDTNPFTDDRDDTFAALYNDGNGLEIETTFTLRGGTNGSGNASLAELISINNTSNQAMEVTFFQYVDLDLGGDAFDDFGQIIDGNIAQQFDDDFFISETVATPQPTLFQIGSRAELFAALTDGDIDTLSGSAAGGPTDIAWAFQWNISLGAGESFLISKNKSIVPAPGTVALMGLGSLAAAGRRRR